MAALAWTPRPALRIVLCSRSTLLPPSLLLQRCPLLIFDVVVWLSFTVLPHILALRTLCRPHVLQVLLDELFMELAGSFGTYNHLHNEEWENCLDILFSKLARASRTLDTVSFWELSRQSMIRTSYLNVSFFKSSLQKACGQR